MKTQLASALTFRLDSTDFSDCNTVSGSYSLDMLSSEAEDMTPNDVEDVIVAAIMEAHGVSVGVEIFHANGYKINGETPTAGSFLATGR